MKAIPANEDPVPVVTPVNVYVKVVVQLSVAVASQLVPPLVYVQVAKSAGTVLFVVHEIVGFWLSTTVIEFEHVFIGLVPSLIVQVTVVTPLLNKTPFSVFDPLPEVAPVKTYVSV